jgi:hypothetical protein
VKDFTEFAVGNLRLPIGGKLYEIPPVTIAVGLLLRRILDPEDVAAIDELRGTDEEAGYRRVLGKAYDEMKADGVPWAALDRAYLTAVVDHQRGRLVAETVWEVGHDPKAIPGLIQAAARIANSGAAEEIRTRARAHSSSTSTNRAASTKRSPSSRKSAGAR